MPSLINQNTPVIALQTVWMFPPASRRWINPLFSGRLLGCRFSFSNTSSWQKNGSVVKTKQRQIRLAVCFLCKGENRCGVDTVRETEGLWWSFFYFFPPQCHHSNNKHSALLRVPVELHTYLILSCSSKMSGWRGWYQWSNHFRALTQQCQLVTWIQKQTSPPPSLPRLFANPQPPPSSSPSSSSPTLPSTPLLVSYAFQH